MSDSFRFSDDLLALPDGLMIAVPNRHTLTVRRHTDESVQIIAEQNESRLVFYVPAEAARHFAGKILEACERAEAATVDIATPSALPPSNEGPDRMAAVMEVTTSPSEKDAPFFNPPQRLTAQQGRALTGLCRLYDRRGMAVRPVMLCEEANLSAGGLSYLIDVLAARGYVRKETLSGRMVHLTPLRRVDGSPYERQAPDGDAAAADAAGARGTIKDAAITRDCLGCQQPFKSEGAHNRLCAGCKTRIAGMADV